MLGIFVHTVRRDFINSRRRSPFTGACSRGCFGGLSHLYILEAGSLFEYHFLAVIFQRSYKIYNLHFAVVSRPPRNTKQNIFTTNFMLQCRAIFLEATAVVSRPPRNTKIKHFHIKLTLQYKGILLDATIVVSRPPRNTET